MAISSKTENGSSANIAAGDENSSLGAFIPRAVRSHSPRSLRSRRSRSKGGSVVNTIALSLAFLFLISLPVYAFAQQPASSLESPDELAQSTTWKPTTSKEIVDRFGTWLAEAQLDEATSVDVTDFLAKRFSSESTSVASASELLDNVIETIAIARPDINQVREALRLQRTKTQPPDFSNLLDNPEEHSFLRDHVRLYYGRWLAQNEFYDEALHQLQQLDAKTILDRPSLLFYRGLMEHQLLKKEECLKTISTLLEQHDRLPKRYQVLSKLMLADLKPLETGSLDEISRLMNDIRRRTNLSRSGKTVIDREVEVIEKLDKLIEDLEAQQQARAPANSVAPSSPMQDSQRAGGKGSGQVTDKQLNDGGNWGDLPPADRAAALAEMAKDMPPHYRAVIEEYFKQLAKENE